MSIRPEAWRTPAGGDGLVLPEPPGGTGPDLRRDAGDPRGYALLIGVDIVSFCTRSEAVQRRLREMMYDALAGAFAMTGLPAAAAYQEDRGDGVLTLLPPGTPPHLALDPFAHHLAAVLRRANDGLAGDNRLRLRVAGHAGFVDSDARGVLGNSVNHLFRLLEAPVFKATMRRRPPADMGLIVSDRLYQDAVQAGRFLYPGHYRPLMITCKETRAAAWVWRPTEPSGMWRAKRRPLRRNAA